MGFDDLVAEWRQLAAQVRRFGDHHLATVLDECARQVSVRTREWLLEELSLGEAAEYSGMTYDTLQRKVGEGAIPNQGRKGSPRVRRCDLPAKAPGAPKSVSEDVHDLVDRIELAKRKGDSPPERGCCELRDGYRPTAERSPKGARCGS